MLYLCCWLTGSKILCVWLRKVARKAFKSLLESELVMGILPIKVLIWNEMNPLPHIVVNAGTDLMISSYLFQADGLPYPTTEVSDL